MSYFSSQPDSLRLLRCSFSLFFILIVACSSTKDVSKSKAQALLPQQTISINTHKLLVEIASSDTERRAGLAHRKHLAPNSGMLFTYQGSKTRYFTTTKTTLALSIAFIDKNGTIVDIQQMQALNETSYKSRDVAQYVLEVNRGWFKTKQVEVGDNVIFPQTLPRKQ